MKFQIACGFNFVARAIFTGQYDKPVPKPLRNQELSLFLWANFSVKFKDKYFVIFTDCQDLNPQQLNTYTFQTEFFRTNFENIGLFYCSKIEKNDVKISGSFHFKKKSRCFYQVSLR